MERRCDNPGQYVWTRVIRNGFGDTWNQYGMTMAAFGDHLYVGTAVGIGMVMKRQAKWWARGPFEIIRIDKDDKAELIVGAEKPPTLSKAAPARVFPRAEWAPDSTTHSMSMPGT